MTSKLKAQIEALRNPEAVAMALATSVPEADRSMERFNEYAEAYQRGMLIEMKIMAPVLLKELSATPACEWTPQRFLDAFKCTGAHPRAIIKSFPAKKYGVPQWFADLMFVTHCWMVERSLVDSPGH